MCAFGCKAHIMRIYSLSGVIKSNAIIIRSSVVTLVIWNCSCSYLIIHGFFFIGACNRFIGACNGSQYNCPHMLAIRCFMWTRTIGLDHPGTRKIKGDDHGVVDLALRSQRFCLYNNGTVGHRGLDLHFTNHGLLIIRDCLLPYTAVKIVPPQISVK